MTKRDTDTTPAPSVRRGEDNDTGSPLQRWSRRKQEASQREGPPEPPQEQGAGRSGEFPEQPQPEAELPPVDSIDESSDVSAFLRPGVDDALQRVALRRLFHSAKFNVTDGLDVYAGNYRNFEPLGDIVTADMRYHAERLAKAAEKLLAGEEERTGDPPVHDSPAGAADGDAGGAPEDGEDEDDAKA